MGVRLRPPLSVHRVFRGVPLATLHGMGRLPHNRDVHFWRDPDVPGVELRWSSYSGKTFREHTHDTFSVGLIESGRAVFQCADGTHHVDEGQIALIPPGVVHACNPPATGNLTYRMFYVDGRCIQDAATRLWGAADGLPAFRAFVLDDARLFRSWRAFHRVMEREAGPEEKNRRFRLAISGLVERHAGHPRDEDPIRPDGMVERIREHIAADLTRSTKLTALANLAGVSPHYLLRTFRETTGLPPHSYRNQLRVEFGKRLLRGGVPIARAAVEAGFVDQSHFTRVFKGFTGATPRQYQMCGGH